MIELAIYIALIIFGPPWLQVIGALLVIMWLIVGAVQRNALRRGRGY